MPSRSVAIPKGPNMLRRHMLAGTATLLALMLTACAGTSGTPLAQPSATAPPGPLAAILATTVLRTGPQRVAFILTRPDSLVTVPQATVSSVYLGDEAQAGEAGTAKFYLWPYGVRGSYSTDLDFSRAGTWRLDINVPGKGDGAAEQTHLLLDVQERVSVAEIGALPPFTVNKTLRDVSDLAELSSAAVPDPGLYAVAIPEAIISGKPAVVVFATPAFCVSPTCGPQVEVLSELKDQYGDEANFIHVELYDNPEEIQGDVSKAAYSPLVASWGFLTVPGWTNESWTFVIDRMGRIAARFEAFVPREELEDALLAALQ